MRDVESWVLAYLLNSLWQVPVLFAAGWVASRAVRGMGPQAEHRVWVGTLVLEAALPACSLRIGDLLRQLWAALGTGHGTTGGEVRIATTASVASSHGVLRLPDHVLACIAVVYGCSVIYFAGQLGWRWWRTGALRRSAERVTGEAARSWARSRAASGIDAEIAISPAVSGPVTVGIRRKLLLVPRDFLETIEPEDLDAVMAHELAHMQRQDFAKNLLYGALSLPVAYHPLLWTTRSRITESREMVCDAMAADAVAGGENYARSLLRLASLLIDRTQARTSHAIGILDANIFERRVMKLIQGRKETNGVRRLAMISACMAIGIATCGTALALRLDVDSPATESKKQQEEIHARVRSAIMANQIRVKTPLVYPESAKADKIGGEVVLHLLIDKEGVPTSIQVVKSVRADLARTAVETISQWRWNPYILNGEPTAVETTFTVHYSPEP